MVPSGIIDRIHALSLDPFTETAVCEIVQEAIDGAGKPSVTLQIPGDWPSNYQEVFWLRYPKKRSHDTAKRALDKIAMAGKTKWADLLSGLDRYIKHEDPKYYQNPATFLNGGSWKNQYSGRSNRQMSALEILTEMANE